MRISSLGENMGLWFPTQPQLRLRHCTEFIGSKEASPRGRRPLSCVAQLHPFTRRKPLDVIRRTECGLSHRNEQFLFLC